MKYNTRDLPVFFRDSNLVTTNQCLGYKYDAYGRILESGLVTGFPADPNAAFTFAEAQIRNYYDGFNGSESSPFKLAQSKVKITGGALHPVPQALHPAPT